MSYNLIIICLILLMPFMCVLVIFSYRQGLKDGRAFKEEKHLEPVMPKVKLFKKREVNEEVKRINDILDNIDNYNGGPVGQKVVK